MNNIINIIVLRHSAFYSPLLMTIAGGYLRDEGLDSTYETATPERTVHGSISAGTSDVAQSAVATSFAALEREESIDIVHFAQINQRDGFFLVGRRPEPDFRWDNLRDREILVDHFFQPLAMFRYGLDRHGLGFDDIKPVNAGDVDMIEKAFRDGRGDYVHLQGPAPRQLERDGVGYLLAAVGDTVGPVAFSSLCARRDWLDSDVALAFMRAYRRALLHVTERDSDEIAARLSEAGLFPSIERDVLARTIADYQRLGCWSPEPAITQSSYEHLLDVFLFSGLITRRHRYESAVVAPPG